MALYSLFVDCQGVGSFGTQRVADSPKSAVSEFLKADSLYEFLAVKGESLPKKLEKNISNSFERFSDSDIILFTPMDGLINMFLCQIGRNGNYVSITIAETVAK